MKQPTPPTGFKAFLIKALIVALIYIAILFIWIGASGFQHFYEKL